jgi:transglutaminase-like putative cysteine protease
MNRKYKIIHSTNYIYEEDVDHSYNQTCIQPLTTSYQNCINNKITIYPKPKYIEKRIDYFGNNIIFFSIEEPHRFLKVKSESLVERFSAQEDNKLFTLPWEAVKDRIYYSKEPQYFSVYEFTLDSPFILRGSLFEDYARKVFTSKRPLHEAVMEFTVKIFKEFKYKSGATTIYTPLEEVLEKKIGVCQDFTHLSIVCLRSIGIPCRYVSGYIETLPPPGKEKLRGSDATHAWFSVYFPGHGWIDFDPTNGKKITDEYIVTAVGRDFSDISPLKGILFGGGKNKLKVEVDVIRD